MLILFRFGIHLPLFGVNNESFSNLASQNNILGFLDLFSGGALGKVSIFALGIGPYITSSIIMQLMAVIIPALEKLQKEDGEAQKKDFAIYTYFHRCISSFPGYDIYGLYGSYKCYHSRCKPYNVLHFFCTYFNSRFCFSNVAF